MTEVIFGPPALQPRKVWTASDFVSVDDRIRGGSSTSAMKDVDKGSSSEDEGTIDFMGFLDTTTLGGAGFASQAYSQPLPGMPVNQTQYKGLRLCVRPVASASNPEKKPSTGKEGANGGSYPGGGRGAVRSYTLNLKTQEPQRRPDGRRESQIVYEYKIVLPPDTAAPSPALTFDSRWQEFEPTYRGRPAENAPPLDPAQIQEWSIMARSDFGVSSMWLEGCEVQAELVRKLTASLTIVPIGRVCAPSHLHERNISERQPRDATKRRRQHRREESRGLDLNFQSCIRHCPRAWRHKQRVLWLCAVYRRYGRHGALDRLGTHTGPYSPTCWHRLVSQSVCFSFDST